MITFASNLILSRTSNKRFVSQNTVNTSSFFHFRHYIFFIVSTHRRISSKSIVMKNFTQSSIQFFFVDVTKKIENELFEIFIDFVYFENASIKKQCTCVTSIFKFWKKTIENFEIFFLSIARRLSLNDTKRLKFVTFITKMRLKNWTWQRIIRRKCWNNVWFTFIKIVIDLIMLKQRLRLIADFVRMQNLFESSIDSIHIVFFTSIFRNIVHLLKFC